MSSRLIDLSHPLEPGTPPWPGNPSVTVDVLDAIPEDRHPGDCGVPGESGYLNATCFFTCNHTGTHMDSPAHFCQDGKAIDQVPLRQVIGPCSLLTIPPCPPDTALDVNDLSGVETSLRRTHRLLLDTGWAAHWSDPQMYFDHFPVLTKGAAEWLVACGLELFGFDSPSVDRVPNPAHRVLLGAQAVIVENLTNLQEIGQPEFELIVTPLPLAGLEASPVRAVARV